MAVGVDALERAERERRAGGGRELAELVPLRLAQLERLGDGERPVPEVRLGPEQLDVNLLLREGAERQSGLERRDASAGDDDTRRLHGTLPRRLGCSIRCMAGSLPRRAGAVHPRRAALRLREIRELPRQARSSASSVSIAAVDPASASATARRERRERVGDDLRRDHPEHRAAREAEPERYEPVEEGDEEERRDGDERLGQAREDTPAGGAQDAHASRDEHEADREALGDVVDRDRDRGHEPERLTAAEGDADADALGERVHRHHADEQQRPAGVGAGERLEVDALPSSQPTRRPGDEEDAGERRRRPCARSSRVRPRRREVRWRRP